MTRRWTSRRSRWMPGPTPTITWASGRGRSPGKQRCRPCGRASRRRDTHASAGSAARSAHEPRPRRARIDARTWERDVMRAEARAGHDDAHEAVVIPHDDRERAAEGILHVQALEVDAHHLEAHGVERIVGVVMQAKRPDSTAPGSARTTIREQLPAVRPVERARVDEKAVVAERDED